eukprot:INCI17169.3.p1 GENE.INCI17169.3~~INCI17169.3.p1  ORF type:complete len:1196 (-),score=221.27 INCI17169.3:1334-4921(-)
MADLASRGADPTRILFDFDDNGNAKRLDPTIFTKKFDVQVVSEADLGHLGDWFRFSDNQYDVGSPAQLMKDVEVWSTLWSPKPRISHRTVLSFEVDVQLDLGRTKSKDFAAFNKSIGQNLISSFVERTKEELRHLHAQISGNAQEVPPITIFDVNLEQPEPINPAGHAVYKINLTLRRVTEDTVEGRIGSRSNSAASSPARGSKKKSSSRLRGLRDAVDHDQLLRKVSGDLEKLANEASSPSNGSPSARDSASRGLSPSISVNSNHLTQTADSSLFPSLEALSGFQLGAVKVCANGFQSIGTLRFTSTTVAAQVCQHLDRDCILRLRIIEGATSRVQTEPRTVVMRSRLTRFWAGDVLGANSAEGGGKFSATKTAIFLAQPFHSANIVAFPQLHELVQKLYGVPPMFHRVNFNCHGYRSLPRNPMKIKFGNGKGKRGQVVDLGGRMWMAWNKFNARAEKQRKDLAKAAALSARQAAISISQSKERNRVLGVASLERGESADDVHQNTKPSSRRQSASATAAAAAFQSKATTETELAPEVDDMLELVWTGKMTPKLAHRLPSAVVAPGRFAFLFSHGRVLHDLVIEPGAVPLPGSRKITKKRRAKETRAAFLHGFQFSARPPVYRPRPDLDLVDAVAEFYQSSFDVVHLNDRFAAAEFLKKVAAQGTFSVDVDNERKLMATDPVKRGRGRAVMKALKTEDRTKSPQLREEQTTGVDTAKVLPRVEGPLAKLALRGWSLLHEACRIGDVEAISKILALQAEQSRNQSIGAISSRASYRHIFYPSQTVQRLMTRPNTSSIEMWGVTPLLMIPVFGDALESLDMHFGPNWRRWSVGHKGGSEAPNCKFPPQQPTGSTLAEEEEAAETSSGRAIARQNTLDCVRVLLNAKACPLARTLRRRCPVTPLVYFDSLLAEESDSSHDAYFELEHKVPDAESASSSEQHIAALARDDKIYDFSALELAVIYQDCLLFDLLLSSVDDKAVVADAAAQQSPFLAMVRTVDAFPKTRKQALGDFTLTSSSIMLSDVVVMGSRLWWHLLLSSTGSAGGKTCALVNWDMPMWWWVSEFASAQHAHIPTDADVTTHWVDPSAPGTPGVVPRILAELWARSETTRVWFLTHIYKVIDPSVSDAELREMIANAPTTRESGGPSRLQSFRISAMPVFDDLVIERAYFVLRHADPNVSILCSLDRPLSGLILHYE